MSTLTQRLKQTDYADRIFDERQLGRALAGSDASRYALVNRALKDGSLVRIKRGLYTLAPPYRSETAHPFAVSQALIPGSYISFESALAYHGWIPEAVYVTAGVTPDRKSLKYDGGSLGQFTFHPLAIEDFQFLTGVQRQKFGKLTGFVATPMRALLDLAASQKRQWAGPGWITQGMRIEESHLLALEAGEFAKLRRVYKHKAVKGFIDELDREVRRLKTSGRAPTDD